MQQFREIITAKGGALRAADPEFAKEVQDSHNRAHAKGGSPHPADLRRLQGKVNDWVSGFVSRPSWNEERDAGAYEAAVAWSHLLQAEIDLHTLGAQHIAPSAGARGWFSAETGKPVRVLTPDEKIANEVHNQVGLGAILNGMMTGPRDDNVRNALSIGTDTAGGYSVPTEVLREFFDKLRAKTCFIQAGARTILIEGKTRIMRVSTDPVPAWRAENAAFAESQPVFDKVDLNPKSMGVLVKASYELLMDSVNVEEALEQVLLGAMSVAIDKACLFGAGTATEPLGLFGTAGINEVSMGANGAAPDNYDDLIDAIYEVELDNGATPTAAIWHPRTAKTYRKLKATDNQPLIPPKEVADMRKLSTTSVPIDQVQGTSNDCSTVLVGDYSQGILGLRESLVIKRLDERFADTGQVAFLARLRADVGFAHPESFTRIVGVKQ